MRATIYTSALISLLIFLVSCGGAEESISDPDCELCPDPYEALPYCPAFESCVEVISCDETLVCAPRDEDNNYNNPDAGSEECDDDNAITECPPGSTEVAECPDGFLCTRITFCEESLLCLELQDACALEPLCPDGYRGVEDYECLPEDETCERNYHCSGPISCLDCELLPEDCPEDSVSVDQEECDDETRPCERVETCDETLYCAAPACEETTCPGESVPVESCPDDGSHCLIRDSCNEELLCGAPEYEPSCREIPTCPEDLQKASLEECLASLDSCTVKAACGQLAACLPTTQ